MPNHFILSKPLESLRVRITRSDRFDWSCLAQHRNEAREVISAFSQWYQDDSYLPEGFILSLRWIHLLQEAQKISEIIGIDPHRVAAANLFYDTCRTRCGCTAFSVKSSGGPMHAYSLDWEIFPEVLRRNVRRFDFAFGKNSDIFHSVGWPGFLGVIVGFATKRFAITLNAVWSDEKTVVGAPVVFIIREALNQIEGFDDAVEFLSSTSLLSDCLLLVTGTRNEEMVVIERTPSGSFVRSSVDNFILVTNHYCSLQVGSNAPGYIQNEDELFGINSEERYDSVFKVLKEGVPTTIHECLLLLRQRPIVQETSVLRVVMRPSTGQMLAEPSISEMKEERGGQHGL